MIRPFIAAATIGVTGALLACSNGTSDPGNCESDYHLDTVQSIATGQIDMSGRIANDESVLLRYTLNGGTPRTVTGVQYDTDTIVFGYLPSGTIQFTIILSCGDEQNEVGSGTIAVK